MEDTHLTDKKGNKIYRGDRLKGLFNAPWDEEQAIELEFIVTWKNGDWWCEGIKSPLEDDFLSEMKSHIEKIERSLR